jgi:hypothetical protein
LEFFRPAIGRVNNMAALGFSMTGSFRRLRSPRSHKVTIPRKKAIDSVYQSVPVSFVSSSLFFRIDQALRDLLIDAGRLFIFTEPAS